MQPRLLVVDDEAPFCLAISRYLSRAGFHVQDTGSLSEARDLLERQAFAGVLLDLRLPDGNGLDSIVEFRRMHGRVALVVVTGSGDVPEAVEAMRRGADHFVTKPIEPAELERILRATIRARGGEEIRVSDSNDYVQGSAVPVSTRTLSAVAADSDAVALLSGETGAGKGALARWIHDHGRRASRAFVEVNCSMLRGELLASELFGHARGAFTSAAETRPGLLDVADGGTLFLDEVGDMDLTIQAQLLKLVEEKAYRRLGETRSRRSDFRLICATNHDLSQDVAAGRFRGDLLYRIDVLSIHLPPLRERSGDIPALAEHLLAKMGHGRKRLSAAALESLLAYDWPGNVRELRNVLERAVLLTRGGDILEIPPLIRPGVAPANIVPPQGPSPAAIASAIEQCRGDKSRAARLLGISRATLYRRLGVSRASH